MAWRPPWRIDTSLSSSGRSAPYGTSGGSSAGMGRKGMNISGEARLANPGILPSRLLELVEAASDAAEWLKAKDIDSQLEESIALLAKAPTSSELTVDLCTCTRGRLWQLARALPLNILQVWPHRNWCKIHVVVCRRDDVSVEWMRKNCRAAIDVGLLHIYQVARDNDFPYWHASVAKNSAANVASRDIIVNVDSDNIVGPDFCVDVAERFKARVDEDHSMVLHYENVDGTCGRIACFRKDFYKIRGYDEEAHPAGAQDVDLLKRLEALPCQYQKVDLPGSTAIPNSKQETVRACDPDIGLTWKEMNAENRDVFWYRRRRDPDLRNQHKGMIGVCLVTVEYPSVEYPSVPVAAHARSSLRSRATQCTQVQQSHARCWPCSRRFRHDCS
jgi:hypothetical protein